MGLQVGHASMAKLRQLTGEANLGLDPVEELYDGLVFGTGEDDSLVAPCIRGSPVEVYGWYGDDGKSILLFSVPAPNFNMPYPSNVVFNYHHQSSSLITPVIVALFIFLEVGVLIHSESERLPRFKIMMKAKM